jgi:hypothetical protein
LLYNKKRRTKARNGEPSSTRRNQKQSSFSSNTELLVHKKHKSISIVFPFNPTPKPLIASCCYLFWGLRKKKKSEKKRKRQNTKNKKMLGENIKNI